MQPVVFVVVPLLAALLVLELERYLRAGLWGGSARLPHRGTLVLVAAVLLFGVWVARFFGAFGGPVPA